MVAPMRQPTDDTGPGRPARDGDVYETDIGEREPSEAVVDVVSAIRDVEPAALAPLYDTIDPDALDSLCSNGERDSRPTVRFDYEGLIVTVSAPDAISVFES